MQETTEPLKGDTVADPIVFGWRTAMANKGFCILFTLVMGALYGTQVYLERVIGSESGTASMAESLFLYLTSALAGAIITLGGANVALLFYRGERPGLGDLFVSLRTILYNFAAEILFLVVVAWPFVIFGLFVFASTRFGMGILTTVTMVALGIGAVVYSILAALRYQFYSYLIVDFGVSPVRALRLSAQITKTHTPDVFGTNLRVLVVNLAGLLCLGVGLLFTVPASFIALGHRYAGLRDLVLIDPPERRGQP